MTILSGLYLLISWNMHFPTFFIYIHLSGSNSRIWTAPNMVEKKKKLLCPPCAFLNLVCLPSWLPLFPFYVLIHSANETGSSQHEAQPLIQRVQSAENPTARADLWQRRGTPPQTLSARRDGSNICITIKAPIVLFFKKKNNNNNHKEFFYSHAKHIFPEDAEAVKVGMHQPAAWKESRQPDWRGAACPPVTRVTPHGPWTSATSTPLANVLLIARHASETFLDRVSGLFLRRQSGRDTLCAHHQTSQDQYI